jgi:hypothetical protein
MDFLLERPSADDSVRFVLAAVRQAATDDAPLLLSLCRASYGGRILGFRTPTLILGCRLRDPSSFDKTLSDVLDGLNARLGWGLIPNTTFVHDRPVVSVKGIRKGIYGKMVEGEHPAFSVLDGWLVCASNGKVLGDMIVESRKRPLNPDQPGWVSIAGPDNGRAVLWADIPAAAKSLARAVAVYDLMWYASSSERSSGPLREGLGIAVEALKSQQSLETLQARIYLDSGEIVVRFRIAARAR